MHVAATHYTVHGIVYIHVYTVVCVCVLLIQDDTFYQDRNGMGTEKFDYENEDKDRKWCVWAWGGGYEVNVLGIARMRKCYNNQPSTP